MDTIVGNFYVVGNKLFNCDEINYMFNNGEYRLYEVLRVSQGVLLFVEDHLLRLQFALNSIHLDKYYNENEARSVLQLLVRRNLNREGNVKLLSKLNDDHLQHASYYIPHVYPTEGMYKTGIKMVSFPIERQDPQIKQIRINEFIRTQINEKLNQPGVYEVLLINHNGQITEGSRSNFFLIKENILFSAPEDSILKGITRKYVLQIADKLGIRCVFKEISLDSISDYESAFICGTSPKVMPVKDIDRVQFNIIHPLLQTIQKTYNKIFEAYLNKHNRGNY